MMVYELNMDGLVGPTHHYAGLALGNKASHNNALSTSNPQLAALQGLKKMRLLYQMGLKQAVLLPHQRPNLQLLYQLGFHGSPEQQISKAYQADPALLSACYSAASMWTANAATVSASTDTQDCKVHFTAANLNSNLHRHHEASFSSQLLACLFSDTTYFAHHPPLPPAFATSDEGAANHNRLCQHHGASGINLFVYGKKSLQLDAHVPKKFPARQTKEASEIIARNHLLTPEQVIFAHQNPKAIDKGVFHNDVISVANESVYLLHEEALLNQAHVLHELQKKASFPITFIEIKKAHLSLEEAVASYLFNSQLLTLPESKEMMLLAPVECQHNTRVKACIDTLLQDSNNPVTSVTYMDLKQSMRNGGGPACLRLRVPLNENELKAMHQGIIINEPLLLRLEQWVTQHYRTELNTHDLLDPLLINETFTALDELTQIVQLGSIYPFQRDFL